MHKVKKISTQNKSVVDVALVNFVLFYFSVCVLDFTIANLTCMSHLRYYLYL